MAQVCIRSGVALCNRQQVTRPHWHTATRIPAPSHRSCTYMALLRHSCEGRVCVVQYLGRVPVTDPQASTHSGLSFILLQHPQYNLPAFEQSCLVAFSHRLDRRGTPQPCNRSQSTVHTSAHSLTPFCDLGAQLWHYLNAHARAGYARCSVWGGVLCNTIRGLD